MVKKQLTYRQTYCILQTNAIQQNQINIFTMGQPILDLTSGGFNNRIFTQFNNFHHSLAQKIYSMIFGWEERFF